MLPERLGRYECLSRPVEESDTSLRPECQTAATHVVKGDPLVTPATVKDSMKRPRLPSFEDHLEYANPPIQPVLVYLRGRIKALGRMGEKVTKKERIAYDVERDFCEVKVQKERILVRVFDMGVSDPKGIVTDIPRSYQWGLPEAEGAIGNRELGAHR